MAVGVRLTRRLLVAGALSSHEGATLLGLLCAKSVGEEQKRNGDEYSGVHLTRVRSLTNQVVFYAATDDEAGAREYNAEEKCAHHAETAAKPPTEVAAHHRAYANEHFRHAGTSLSERSSRSASGAEQHGNTH